MAVGILSASVHARWPLVEMERNERMRSLRKTKRCVLDDMVSTTLYIVFDGAKENVERAALEWVRAAPNFFFM